jgi:hypothetical protein
MRYRSFFWPAILIILGVIALGVNLGAISADRLYRLADLWPLILIVTGMVVISRRAWQGSTRDLAAGLIVLVAVVGAAAYVAVRGPVPSGSQTLSSSDTVGSLNRATLHVSAGAATLRVGRQRRPRGGPLPSSHRILGRKAHSEPRSRHGHPRNRSQRRLRVL